MRKTTRISYKQKLTIVSQFTLSYTFDSISSPPLRKMDQENIGSNCIRPTTAPAGKLGTPSAKTAFGSSISKTPTMSASKRSNATTPLGSSGSFSASKSLFGNSSRDAARIAKEQDTAERIAKVAELKEKWAADKAQKKKLNKQKKKAEIQRIQDESVHAAEIRAKNLQRKREIEERKKEEEKELLSSSLQANLELSAELKKQKQAKRRISIFLNNTMKARQKEAQAKLEAQKKEEEVDLLQSRRLDHLQLRMAKQQEEENRRESLNFRLLSASKQRKIEEELDRKAAELEKEMIEVRRQNWLDDSEAAQEQVKSRRDSLAGRLNMWRSQKAVDEEKKIEKKEEVLDLLQSRHNDWVDIQNYKTNCAKRIRESMAGRLDHWRDIKTQEQQDKLLEDEAKALETIFKQEAVEDLKKYQEANKESRRKSLAYRLNKAKQDKALEQNMQQIAKMVEEEEREIQRAEIEDVNNYKQKLADERRASLDYRNLFEMNDRNRVEELNAIAADERKAEFERKVEDWHDVQDANANAAEERRKSMAWRLADASRKHAIDLAEHEEKLNALHDQFEWRKMVHEANEEQKMEAREKRRQSVALAQESWRAQTIAEKQLRARKEMEAEENARWKSEDAEALREAKEILKITAIHGGPQTAMIF